MLAAGICSHLDPRRCVCVNDIGQIISHEAESPVGIAMVSGLEGLLIMCDRLVYEGGRGMRSNDLAHAFNYMSTRVSGDEVLADSIAEYFKSALTVVNGSGQDSEPRGDLSTVTWDDKCREALKHTISKVSRWR